MPIYEFQCLKCNKLTEMITVYIQAVGGIQCECGATAQLIMSAANFVTDETRARRILSKGRKAKGQSRGKIKN